MTRGDFVHRGIDWEWILRATQNSIRPESEGGVDTNLPSWIDVAHVRGSAFRRVRTNIASAMFSLVVRHEAPTLFTSARRRR